MGEITLIPVGGLANRIRVIESGIRLSKETNSRLKVIWYKDNGIGCRFEKLFRPFDDDMIEIKEASCKDFIYDRPRLKNLYFPYITEKLLFDHCIYEKQSCFNNEDIDYKTIAKNKKIYIATFMPFYLNTDKDYYHLFKPIPEIQMQIKKISGNFPENIIGIQIRRGDNWVSMKLSPTDLFIEKMNQEKDAAFYLATDSDEEKEKLAQLFGKRILFLNNTADRTTEKGIQEALVEMFLLSKTKKIYGSVHSSFGQIASRIGKNEFELLSIKKD